MTVTDPTPQTSRRTDSERARAFAEAFGPFLDRVRAGAVQRERDRTLLYDEVAELRTLGFSALRLPVSQGGAGIDLETFFGYLIDLSAADSNLGHLYRGHIAFVEGLLLAASGTDGAFEADTRVWIERIAAGELVGNAQSERQELGEITTRLERGDDGVFLTGRKYYTTGSIYADWIHLAALDGEERVSVTVWAGHEGVTSVDDWDGFGQPLTGSGTTTFERVPVDPVDIVAPRREPGVWNLNAAVFQLSLLAVVAGVAQGALADTVAFVRPRRRTFGFAGETPPREDPLVQAVVGTVSSAAHAARALILQAARELDRSLARLQQGTLAEGELQERMLDAFRLQQVVLPLVLDAVTELFEVGGATAVSRSAGLDRHWRNVRTIASHNPAIQRKRAIGQFELNGSLPEWKAPGARTEAAR